MFHAFQHLAPFFKFLRDICRYMRTGPVENTVFFLAMLPNLRVAELDIDISSKRMLEILKAWPNSMLSRVEDLRLKDYVVEPPAMRSSIDYLIQLPSVQTFHGMWIDWKEYQGPALGLRHLVLISTLRTHAFYNILSNCPKLETLKIETWASYTVLIDFSIVGKTLRDLGQNLEKLDLDAFFRRSIGTIGPLRSLTRLKELTIPWDVLARKSDYVTTNGSAQGHTLPRDIPKLTDLLPSSLEYLSLHLDCVYLQNWQLLDLVRSERFPRLQTIRLTRDRGPVYKYGERQAAFRRDLSKLGWDLRQFIESRYGFQGSVALLEKGSTQTLGNLVVFEGAETADSFDIYGLRTLFRLL